VRLHVITRIQILTLREDIQFLYISFNSPSLALLLLSSPTPRPSTIYSCTLLRRLQPVVPCCHDASHFVTQTTKITELRLPGIVFIHLPRPDHGCCVATTEQVTCESVGARPSATAPLSLLAAGQPHALRSWSPLAAECAFPAPPSPKIFHRALCPNAVDPNARSDVSLRPLNPGLLVRDWEAKSASSFSS